MSTTPCFLRITTLIILSLLIATSLAAQPQSEQRSGVSVIVEPARATLVSGQTQKFSAHIEGAPGAVVQWAITEGRSDGSSIGQDGIFTAGTLGVYHVLAFAVKGDGTVLKAVRVKVTVLGRSEL
jgi:hypothetical protein